MLPSDLSWVTFASLVLGVSCANDFVTSGSKSFPSQFGLDRKTTIYWGNRTGFIAGIYVYTNGQSDDSADYTWVLAPNCPGDSDDDCVAHDNSGSAPFYVNGTAVPLGSGYQLRLLWTTSKRYDDVDDDTEETASPSFSVVPAESIKGPTDVPKGLGAAEKAGIAIAVVVVVVFLLLVLWLRWRKEKRIKRRRTRQMRDARDSKQGGWYERWTMGKRKDTDDSWTAANLPAKPSPAAAADVRKDSKTGSDGQLYIDDKAEMPTDAGNRHEVHAQGTSAARNKTELDGTSAPLGPAAVELPAEPVSGQNSALQSRTASTATSGTMFEYNPNPSYSLQAPASPHPDANTVSPVSEGVGTFNSMAGSVSPVTPIARKPVGGTIRAVPEQQHQQQQYKDPGRQITVMTDADDEAPRRGKSAILRKEKSRIWKMLGGGSTKGKLNPASGANA
ncbi:hypothetical protein N8I77_004162 [Diaporthe amygdali]|uniref:Uncharacterized protein n=1 Tax=Phomopsis amygdali TaxID=1214568 RepID=A0AAD9SLD8_PHOAM|nr:hypothetical protein N8I77_004162 [Diaporthe amygdali]